MTVLAKSNGSHLFGSSENRIIVDFNFAVFFPPPMGSAHASVLVIGHRPANQ
jgi:hypothetical protein